MGLRKRSEATVAPIDAGVAPWTCAFAVGLGALALTAFTPTGVDRNSTACLVLLLSILASFLVLLQLGKAYNPRCDLFIAGSRGLCSQDEEQDSEELVREMYKVGSYQSVKTGWPLRTLFSFLGAVFISSVTDPPRFLPSVCVGTLVIYVAQSSVLTLTHAHTVVENQVDLDNLFCRYRSALTRERSTRSNSGGATAAN